VDLDLDAIQADLDGVQSALGRLAEGSYWTDEVTGEPIPGDVLAANPTARRAATVS
jgi:RNA polymerase-binding transcription factor DksA